jgi:hypothetical protein
MSLVGSFVITALAVAGGARPSGEPIDLRQPPGSLLAGEVMAVAYSGYREGQHPDRGDGAVNPSSEGDPRGPPDPGRPRLRA